MVKEKKYLHNSALWRIFEKKYLPRIKFTKKEMADLRRTALRPCEGYMNNMIHAVDDALLWRDSSVGYKKCYMTSLMWLIFLNKYGLLSPRDKEILQKYSKRYDKEDAKLFSHLELLANTKANYHTWELTEAKKYKIYSTISKYSETVQIICILVGLTSAFLAFFC